MQALVPPDQHYQCLRTPYIAEHLNPKIRHRKRIVTGLPNDVTVCLLGALLSE